MGLQEVFYILGIIYMSMGIVLLLALVIAVFYIKKKVTDLERTFTDKFDLLHKIATRPAESAVDIGASLAEAAIDRFKNVFDKKTKK